MCEDSLCSHLELLLLNSYFLIDQLTYLEIICRFGKLAIILIIDVQT
jgi:hypothetical protein